MPKAESITIQVIDPTTPTLRGFVTIIAHLDEMVHLTAYVGRFGDRLSTPMTLRQVGAVVAALGAP